MATQMVLHISPTWVKIRLHTENQLHRLPGSALKVPGGWVVGYYPLSSPAPTHVEVELGCDNIQVQLMRCVVLFWDEIYFSSY